MNNKGDVSRYMIWFIVLLILVIMIISLFYMSASELIKNIIYPDERKTTTEVVTKTKNPITTTTTSTTTTSTKITSTTTISTTTTTKPIEVELPNCGSLSGPSTLRVGERGTYKGNFYSPGGDLRAVIGVGDYVKLVDISIVGNTLNDVTATWRPTSVGNYLISCRAWDDDRAECRYSLHVDGPSRYPCEGPDNFMWVNVVAPDCSSCLGGLPTCDEACQSIGKINGYCNWPGSTDPGRCCVCY